MLTSIAIVAVNEASSSSSDAVGGSNIDVIVVDHRVVRVFLVAVSCGDHTLGVDCVQPVNAAAPVEVRSTPMNVLRSIVDLSKDSCS